MKQKSDSSQTVTKVYLDDRFRLNNAIFDLKLENLERRIDENAQKYRDQVLTANDKIVKELEVMREENIIGFSQIARLNKRVDDHDKQIKILKSS
jgi:hypothetical protein